MIQNQVHKNSGLLILLHGVMWLSSPSSCDKVMLSMSLVMSCFYFISWWSGWVQQTHHWTQWHYYGRNKHKKRRHTLFSVEIRDLRKYSWASSLDLVSYLIDNKAVSSMSDCRSRGREFFTALVPYFRGVWSWNNFYDHFSLFRWFKKGCCEIRVQVCAWSTG